MKYLCYEMLIKFKMLLKPCVLCILLVSTDKWLRRRGIVVVLAFSDVSLQSKPKSDIKIKKYEKIFPQRLLLRFLTKTTRVNKKFP